ncbi:MAG TPA: family 20 glycosylhydrolase, partial [Spirochaetia bacterium]|nr:family 20 glycosylhydrolase [Spirochaetia bacterium]
MALPLSKLILLPRPRAITDGAGSCPGQPVSRRVQPDNLPAEGYRIRLDASGVEMVGADPAGLFYAEATLAQVKRQAAGERPAGTPPPGALPAGIIEDWPDYAVRGVMLDISRDKVPTMETLESLVELLSSLKVNHLQLYTEHTFAYSNHREVWAEASPMTADEIRRLDAYCRRRFVELAPNQNSFGHLERWLALPRYIGLSECPRGFDWPWGGRSEGPFSLDPSNPASLTLLEELFDELLPAFTSRRFNVGCDETFDLGQGRNRERCEREGKGRVYLQFLKEIHRRVTQRGCTMLYWGDIIMEHPELVPELPRDAIALEWGYESHHPFDEHGAKYRAAGVPWWVCPGTSSWNSFAGRTENCLGNLRAAARAGRQHGATGFLNTDWGDNGHWQFLPVSWLGLAAGAALSWCIGASEETDFASELDAHVFGDRAAVMGAAARDLGDAYLHTGARIHNESALFQVLRYPDRTAAPQGVTAGAVADTRAWIEAAAARLV